MPRRTPAAPAPPGLPGRRLEGPLDLLNVVDQPGRTRTVDQLAGGGGQDAGPRRPARGHAVAGGGEE